MNDYEDMAGFEADLSDLAGSIQPDAQFVAGLGEHLLNERKQIQPPRRGENTRREKRMIASGRMMRQPLGGMGVLAAALLIAVLGGVMLVTRPVYAPLPAAVQDAPTELPMTVGGWVSDFSEETLQKMRDAGMTWISGYVFYNSDGVGEALNTAQILISAAHEAGFKIMLQVTGEPGDIMENRRDYNAMLAITLGYIAKLGPDAIQVWAEPNIDRNWLTGEINSAAYVTMLRQAYMAIKANNPDVMVISAAPAPTSAQDSFPDQIVNDDVYYQGMANAGAADYADCIGMTYVEGVVPPNITSGDPRDNTATRYLPTMLERAYEPFRDSGLPLCITNFGYATPEGTGELVQTAFGWAKDTTVAQQAAWTAEAITLLAEQPDIPVEMAMIWRINPYLIPPDYIEPFDAAAYFSIIRPDGSCAACDALGTLRQ